MSISSSSFSPGINGYESPSVNSNVVPSSKIGLSVPGIVSFGSVLQTTSLLASRFSRAETGIPDPIL